MKGHITKLSSALLDPESRRIGVMFELEDGSKASFTLSASVLAELAGVAGIASEAMEDAEASHQEDERPARLVGASTSVAPDATILVRLQDGEGFFHEFEADEARASSLRFVLRRAIQSVRGDQSSKPAEGVRLVVDNPAKT